jgi:hypothetical protein
LTLGHYGMPHMNGKKADVQTFDAGLGKGITASISRRKVALIVYNGWDRIQSLVHKGFNAEGDESTVLNAYRKRTTKNPAMELMISVMLHSTSDAPFTTQELSPITDIILLDVMPSGSVVGAEITLSSGVKHVVDFKDVDGFKSC